MITTHRHRRKASVRIVACLAAVGLIAACGGDDDAVPAATDAPSATDPADDPAEPAEEPAEPADEPADAPTVRIGQIPTSGLVIGHVLDQQPEGLELTGRDSAYELEVTQFSGSPDIVQGIAAGTLDGGAVGATAIFPLLRQEVGVTIVGEYFEERSDYLSPSFLTTADSGITSIEDLRGKTVGINSVGSPVYWAAVGHLRAEAGLEPDEDYTVVAVPFPNMLDALDAGEIDIAPIIQPWLAPALESGKYSPLFDDTDVQDPYVQSLMVLRNDFIEEHPDATAAFVADWAASAEFVRDPANHDAVVQAVADATSVPAENLGYVATEEHYYFPEQGMPNIEAIQSNWDWFFDVGGIDEQFDVNDYVNPDLLP